MYTLVFNFFLSKDSTLFSGLHDKKDENETCFSARVFNLIRNSVGDKAGSILRVWKYDWLRRNIPKPVCLYYRQVAASCQTREDKDAWSWNEKRKYVDILSRAGCFYICPVVVGLGLDFMTRRPSCDLVLAPMQSIARSSSHRIY